MTDAVVDASALVFALTTRSASAATLSNRLGAIRCHAPHQVDAECGHALRGLVRRGEAPMHGYELRTDRHSGPRRPGFGGRPDRRSVPSRPVVVRPRMAAAQPAELYDALYVALAVRLDVPLTTCDRRLANSPGLPCRVELVG